MSVASKNLYDLLGNDDGDSDTPKGPVKTVDKAPTHTTKRNADGVAPLSRAPAATGNRRGGVPSGNDGAFRDRFAGSDRNRSRPVDDSARGGARGGTGARVRGGRGSRFPRERDDRHSKSAPGGGSEKQAAQSWGAPEGQSELKDEQAGEAIAQSEHKEAAVEGAEGDLKEAEPAEPEDNHISYTDYLAQQAEKKQALEAEANLKVRQANEGVKADKKWGAAKPLVKEGDENYFAGSGGKAKRERERKTKQLVDIDQRYVEPEQRTRGGGGGRGGRGGAGRGDSSRGFGRGGPRGGGGPGRGEPRGGAPRGDFRGGRGRGGGGQPVNPNDQSAFPSLGS